SSDFEDSHPVNIIGYRLFVYDILNNERAPFFRMSEGLGSQNKLQINKKNTLLNWRSIAPLLTMTTVIEPPI
ncbi:hypothetical protein CJD36_021270, partial [Flavipsychrobacter stenotrophus]